MRSFIAALTIAVACNAIELEVNTEANTELQAQANAAMINDYLMAQVNRLNAEDVQEQQTTTLAQTGESSTWGAFFGLW